MTEAQLSLLVDRFYAKVREDEVLGPVFNGAIADWPEHLEKLSAFWSSVMLTSGRYKGNPMAAHMRLGGVTPEHFDTWLALFGETAEEVCGPELAPLFLERARTIAASLKLGMFYRPGAKAAS